MNRSVLAAILVAGLAACGRSPTSTTSADQTSSSDRSAGSHHAPPSAGGRPNIVFILTDDQDAASTWAMPHLNNLIAARGTTFRRFYYSLSLCCPSRTTMLRGQYPHNHQIHSNQLPNGGWRRVQALGLESSTVATWLRDAGYNTSYIGKYLNEYHFAPAGYIPPGWTDWHAVSSELNLSTTAYNYRLNENGITVSYGSDPTSYSTDIFSARAVEFIQAQATATRPFFLWVSPNGLSIPANRHAGRFMNASFPQELNYNEADVSDKPLWVRNNPLLNGTDLAFLTGKYRKRLETLQAVDEMIKAIVDALTASGQLDNTFIVFASDNGFHLGQHRLKSDPNSAYEEDIRGPLYVRGPDVAHGLVLDHLVMNNDLAPTFAEIAAAVIPGFVDGRSFLSLLSGGGPPPTSWRQQAAVEYDALPQPAARPTKFFALRTRQFTYTEYVTGERELYDNVADPWQLMNIAATAPPELLSALAARLAAVLACTGAGCRAAEDTPITLPTPSENQLPAAAITSPSHGVTITEGASVDFAGSGMDPEEGSLSGPALVWTSSQDGQIGAGTGFSTRALSVGSHTITLTARDTQDATGTATLNISIVPAPTANQPPTASFTWTCGPPVPHQCTFNSGISSDDAGIVARIWNWGDGRTGPSTGPVKKNSWASAGAFTVTLTVQDAEGLTGSISKVVAVP
jgi:N-acetylglucosamine-6-sulfatase